MGPGEGKDVVGQPVARAGVQAFCHRALEAEQVSAVRARGWPCV